MKLYDLPHSPFAARVRIQIYAKNLAIEAVPPPGFGSEQYRQLNPLGKVPALDTGERIIPESWVIMEYLEDRFPSPALRPADPERRADMNVLARMSDVNLQPALLPLFQQVIARKCDDQQLANMVAGLRQQLGLLDTMLAHYNRAGEHPLDLADCALVPVLHYAMQVPRWLGQGEVEAGLQQVQAYMQWAWQQPHCSKVLGEIDAGVQSFMQRGK